MCQGIAATDGWPRNSAALTTDAPMSYAPGEKYLGLLYREMRAAERKVGGGEGCCGVNGTVTEAGMRCIAATLMSECSLSTSSIVVDVGSALGRPLLHFCLAPGAACFGIEMDEVKCQKSLVFLQSVFSGLHQQRPGCLGTVKLPTVICRQVEQVESLEPATHVYTAWEGFSEASKTAVGKLFAASSTAQAIAIVQRANIFGRQDPEVVMQHLGFGDLRLVQTHHVHLAGGHTRLRAYIFTRRQQPAQVAAALHHAGTERPRRYRGGAGLVYLDGTQLLQRQLQQLHELQPFEVPVPTVQEPYNTRSCRARRA